MKKTFLNHLISYILIFLLPIVMLTFIMFHWLIGYLNGATIHEHLHHLETIRNSFDMQIEQLDSIVMQLASDPAFSSYRLKETTSSFYEVEKSLNTILGRSHFASDVFYYNNVTDRFYTPDSVFTPENFYNYYKRYQNYSQESFLALFQNVTESTWIPLQQMKTEYGSCPGIAYMVPFYKNHADRNSVVCFQIDEATLSKLLSTRTAKGIYTVISSGEQILYTSNGTAADAQLYDLISSADGESFVTADYNDQECAVYRVEGAGGLSYSSIIPLELFYADINQYKMLYLMGVSVVILGGAVLICILMKRNFEPLSKIFTLAASISPVSNQSQDGMENLQNTLLDLSQKTKRAKRTERESLLLSLIHGQITDRQEFNRQGEEFGLKFTRPCYMTVIFVLNSTEPIDGAVAADQIQSIMCAEFEAYTVLRKNGRIVLLLGLEENQQRALKEKLGLLQAFLDKTDHVTSLLCVSKLADRFDQFGKSYFEASMVTKYPGLTQDGKPIKSAIVYCETPEAYFDGENYPTELLKSLASSIEKRDPEKIKVVGTMLSNMINQVENETLVSCLLYDIISLIDKALRNDNRQYFNFEQKYSQLMYNATLGKEEKSLFAWNVISEVSQIVAAESKNAPQDNSAKIKEFIDANAFDPNLCVTAIADRFHMSNSNLSHCFKNKFGMNISEYIHSLRLEKAKQLLVNTHLTIREIVSNVGYVQTSGFMRRFKATYGVTPTEYRKSMTQKSSQKKGNNTAAKSK